MKRGTLPPLCSARATAASFAEIRIRALSSASRGTLRPCGSNPVADPWVWAALRLIFTRSSGEFALATIRAVIIFVRLAIGRSRSGFADRVSPVPADSGQIAIAITATSPKASRSPAIAAIRLIIRWVAQGADQTGGDHPDDQERDAVQGDRAEVPIGPQPQPGVDDHVDRHGGEEPAEEQADQQQGVPEVGIQFGSVDG